MCSVLESELGQKGVSSEENLGFIKFLSMNRKQCVGVIFGITQLSARCIAKFYTIFSLLTSVSLYLLSDSS